MGALVVRISRSMLKGTAENEKMKGGIGWNLSILVVDQDP